MFRLRRVFAVIVALAILSAPTHPSFAQSIEAPTAQADEALIRDAKEYASTIGVDLDEAIRRLQLQSAIGELNRELTEKEGDTFAGLWIQHQPEYRVIVQFTRDGQETIRPYIEAGPLADMVEVRTASVTLKQLEATQAQAVRVVRGLGIDLNSGLNVFENRAELYVLDEAQVNAALRQVNLQLPANIEVIQVNELAKPATDIYGGLPNSDCTTGFSVKYLPTGEKGVTTAGHCLDTQYYNGWQLPYKWGNGGGVYDIQWNSAPGLTVRNLVWDGTYNRFIYNYKFRSSQYVGEWVCKYGRTTGYGCGQIINTAFDGVNVQVNIPVSYGDSGGPWFWNNTAYGTTISFSGNTSIYGPVDHIYNVLRVSILTN